jgi:hypothetical protein
VRPAYPSPDRGVNLSALDKPAGAAYAAREQLASSPTGELREEFRLQLTLTAIESIYASRVERYGRNWHRPWLVVLALLLALLALWGQEVRQGQGTLKSGRSASSER